MIFFLFIPLPCSLLPAYAIGVFFQVGGPMNKILVLRNKRVFKGLFIHLIGCEHDQDLGPPFSCVFKQFGHWSSYLEKRIMLLDMLSGDSTKVL